MKALAGCVACTMATVALLACGDDDDRTGVTEVDRVIEAVEAQDVETLASMLTYFEEPCGTPEAIPAPPPCPQGEPEGTPLEVWWSAECEGYYVTRAETATQITSRVGHADIRLYAVYRDGSQLGFGVDYVILFSQPVPRSDMLLGQSVALSGGRIQSWTTICGLIESAVASLEDGGAVAILGPRDD
jgi:hypothetical protein